MEAAAPVSGAGGAQLTGAARAEYVRSMFARIVPRYDLFNTLSTFGQDRHWRQLLVRYAAVPPGGRVLDVATGTGAVAFALAGQTPTAQVVGLDFCEPMITAAQTRAAAMAGPAEGGPAAPSFVVGDALDLPYAGESFDAVTIAFGLRNLADMPRGLREIRRVLKPGGRFVCLELTPVRSALIRMPFHLYFYRFAPLLGGLLSGDRDAYTYLPHSVAHFPDADTLARMMLEAGFGRVRYRRLNFGTIAIHLAER
jgi:demethylmenaquinone methyltransferase/2-methoxy-6-polyprenyl-1,4-benzoquinol methylase